MKKSDIIKASIAKFRAEAQALLDNPNTTKEQFDEITNKISLEETKLELQLKNEDAEREALNENSLPVENTILNNKEIKNELFEQALDVQNYILGNPNNMQVVQNSLSTGTEGSGGVAVGATLSKEIIRTLKERANAYGFFSGRVGEGNLETIIISDETPAEWVAEGETPAGQADPKTSKIVIKQHRLYKEIELTQQLINSSSEEFVNTIVDIVVDAIKDTLEKAIFVGTGVGQPTGIITGLDTKRKVELGTVGEITLEALKVAKYKIPQADWNECSWFMDTTTLLAVDNLKDSTGRPLLQPDPSQPTKQILLGIKISTTNGMPEATQASSAIAVIAHKNAYQTNTQKTITLDVYNDSTYKKKGVVGFASNIYVDGKCKNANKVAAIFNPAV